VRKTERFKDATLGSSPAPHVARLEHAESKVIITKNGKRRYDRQASVRLIKGSKHATSGWPSGADLALINPAPESTKIVLGEIPVNLNAKVNRSS
jgi:hypothetical protein